MDLDDVEVSLTSSETNASMQYTSDYNGKLMFEKIDDPAKRKILTDEDVKPIPEEMKIELSNDIAGKNKYLEFDLLNSTDNFEPGDYASEYSFYYEEEGGFEPVRHYFDATIVVRVTIE